MKRIVSGLPAVPAVVGVFVLGALVPSEVLAAEDPIVYVRCPRTQDSLTLSTGVTLQGLDIYDPLPDVSNFYGDFVGPCDLVLRDPDGSEQLLYDCGSTSTKEQACAAMDPAVSFDGETIAFSVFSGALVRMDTVFLTEDVTNGASAFVELPIDVMDTTGAQLHLVDVATGDVTALPVLPGGYDSGPAWLADGRLAFTSDRDGNLTTMIFGRNGNPGRGNRIWTMDIDGRNLDLASHHSLGGEQHPLLLQDGRVAYSSWQVFGGRPFSTTNGVAGGFSTLGNEFHIFTQHPDGANQFAFFGQHAGSSAVMTVAGVTHLAAHFLGQSGDGRVWFADYYRRNNKGLGHVVGVMPEPEGQEGMFDPEAPRADLYAPRDAFSLASWSANGDNFAGVMADPPYIDPEYADRVVFAGKLGHPSGLPDNQLLVTWGKGACSTVASDDVFEALGLPTPPGTNGSGGAPANVFTHLAMDTPACDLGVYNTTVIPSTHPSDLERVVDSREWHEFMARAVVPYADIHGMDRPEELPRADLAASHGLLPLGTPFGLLGAASILDRETHPAGGIHFAGEDQFHLQGTDSINYDDDDLCGVRILGVLPNRGDNTFNEVTNVSGERVVILGELGVRHYDDEGGELLDPSDNPDTSFLLRMPANVPYLMQGLDCEGRMLNTDQTWQSLRPGETKTCGGCHVHSKPSRVDFEETAAALSDYEVVRLGEGLVPLLAGPAQTSPIVRTVEGYGLQIGFEEDIVPIFEARCNDCHGGASPSGNLALDVPGIEDGSTWACLVRDRHQQCVPAAQRMVTTNGTAFRRPQLTRYVRAFNALGSLLYWKAAGERTDGNTDATFDAASADVDRDLDFGPDHPTEATPEELGLIARWIEIGSPGTPGELFDTQRPTLSIAATVEGESVTALHVGTVDIPSGIDVDSLVVCIVGQGGACGANLAAAGAAVHGEVEIVLDAGLDNPDVEVEARVADLAGNETVLRVTVGRLLNSPPPPPGGGETSGTGDTGEPGDDTGATEEGGGSADPTGSDTGGAGAETGGAGASGGDSGCGCRADSTGGVPWWALVLVGGLVRRRSGTRSPSRRGRFRRA